MSGIADNHMHLRPDDDGLDDACWSVPALRAYVEAARARGVDELAITEHVYRFTVIEGVAPDPERQPGPYWAGQPKSELADYLAALEAAREAGLPLVVGIELDWVAGAFEALAAIAHGASWDVVLGSVHWVPDGAVDDPRYTAWVDGATVEGVWRAYFATLWDAARSGLYDVMTHPDLVKYAGRFPARAVVEELHQETAEVFAAAGVCVEINTAGLRKPIGELYPAPDLLARCRRAGVPLSLGSDAHVAGDAARDFDLARAAARAAGYETTTRFREREPRQVPLG